MTSPTLPRPLVVLGATFEIKEQLKRLHVSPIYVDDPVAAMDAVLDNPDAILAYAPGVFGLVCSGQPVKVVPAHRSLVLTSKPLPEPKPAVLKANEFQAFEEDPETLARQAAMTLRAKLLLCLDSEEAQRALQALLIDMAPEVITAALRSAE